MVKHSIVTVALVVSFVSGCSIREKPILEIRDVAIANSESGTVAQKIEAALKARHWRIVERQPGVLVAKFAKPGGEVGVISATINIAYDENSYSIAYLDSENLLYDSKTGTIHRNYNRWVANLERDLAMAF